MVIFLNEDRAYVAWVSHHSNGFVLDWLRKPTQKRPILHRATCTEIRASGTKKAYWTTGRHLKACSLRLEELAEWAKAESEDEAIQCESCRPGEEGSVSAEELSSGEPQHDHLTKLGHEILDYVLETAVIQLDQNAADYKMTVGEAASYLKKTPAQITSALLRLVEDGLIGMDGDIKPGDPLPARRAIHPTIRAMKTLPAFAKMSDHEVQKELDRLRE